MTYQGGSFPIKSKKATLAVKGLPKVFDSNTKQRTDRLLKEGKRHNARREFKRSVECLQQLLELAPEKHQAHCALGEAYVGLGDMKNALVCFLKAVSLDPTNGNYYHILSAYLHKSGNEVLARDYARLALRFDDTLDTSRARALHLESHFCDWDNFSQRDEDLAKLKRTSRAIEPFGFLGLADNLGFQKERSEIYARVKYALNKSKSVKPHPKKVGEKIRLGYFSNDFHEHATMHLLGNFFEMLDRSKFEVVIYDYGSKKNDACHKKVQNQADEFYYVAELTDEEIAEKARRDRIDIGIDLKGYTHGTRSGAFHCRVAPLQISYLGYPGTSGIKAMDYIVTDLCTTPPEARRFYTEKTINLPVCYQINDNTKDRPTEVAPRHAFGLPDDAFVFCSFNSPYKVTPEEFDIWMQLLKDVPGSVLWFLAGKEVVEQNITAEAEKRGVDPSRIVFAERLDKNAHLARQRHADLFLDTFNVNAHTTASEALWMGVPVLTKMGKQFAARVAGSLNHAVGMEEMTVETNEAYYQRALELARQPEKLQEMKDRLKDPKSLPLFDSERFVRDFEALLLKAYERQAAGKKPGHLTLA